MFIVFLYLLIKAKGHLPSCYGNTNTRFYDNSEKGSTKAGCEKEDLLKKNTFSTNVMGLGRAIRMYFES